ncbi:uncharacterized protein [Palaemon carinicauda]|uniref:uncharacterized protein n=1 Tax=Palaemon carinicauda TaxID=392227 RepID=UPI0035B62573
MVSELGIRKSDKFVSKVREFPRPRTVRELRGFLGLIEFGWNFVRDYSRIGKLLNEWTGKKNSTGLKWDEHMIEALEKLKEEVARDITLAIPDYSEHASMLELYMDASGISMGDCLVQMQRINGDGQLRVIAYVCDGFDKAE